LLSNKRILCTRWRSRMLAQSSWSSASSFHR
jgi:hypothetical protein